MKSSMNPLSNYLIVLDFFKTKDVDYPFYYQKDTLELEHCDVYQFLYYQEDLMSDVKIEIRRPKVEFGETADKTSNEVVEKIIDTFKDYTKLILTQVKHDENSTICKFSKSYNEEINFILPRNLDWMTKNDTNENPKS